MTYKALRRISDKQWMDIDYSFHDPFFEIEYPKPMEDEKYHWYKHIHPEVDWSLYELIEVVVIPVDEMPSDCVREACNYVDNHSESDGFYDAFITGYNLYKSQILKP